MIKWICLLLGVALSLNGTEFISKPSSYSESDIRIVPVTPTPEPNHVALRVIFPRPYENKRKNPVNIQLRLQSFPLGMMTENERAKEIYNDPEGQTLHVIVDNALYFTWNQTMESSSEEDLDFYDKLVSFYLPNSLRSGRHILRCFPVRSYGESLKGKGCFMSQVFYFQDRKKSSTSNIDLEQPYLTYNEPQGRYPFHKSNPILLDFYLSNCELSAEGYKVRVSIDGKVLRLLTNWSPYYLYGLQKGKHKIQLELLDANHSLVSGDFNVTEREIEID